MRVIAVNTGDKFDQWYTDNLKYMIDNYSNLNYDKFEVIDEEIYEGVFDKLQKFDLLLSDVLMPQMNGIELTKKVHDLYPSLPIIVCSEGGSTDAKELVASIVMNKAISFGAVFALKKPFKKATIQEVIKSILEGEIPDQKN